MMHPCISFFTAFASPSRPNQSGAHSVCSLVPANLNAATPVRSSRLFWRHYPFVLAIVVNCASIYTGAVMTSDGDVLEIRRERYRLYKFFSDRNRWFDSHRASYNFCNVCKRLIWITRRMIVFKLSWIMRDKWKAEYLPHNSNIIFTAGTSINLSHQESTT